MAILHAINQIRSISEDSINKLKNCLDEIDFNTILQIQCPNEAYNSFLSYIILLSKTHLLFGQWAPNQRILKENPGLPMAY